jgi:hypothetical protein
VGAPGCQGKSLVNQQESRVCERVLQRFLITMRKVFECMAVFILARPFNAAKTWRRRDSARATHLRPATESLVAGHKCKRGGVGL